MPGIDFLLKDTIHLGISLTDNEFQTEDDNFRVITVLFTEE